MKIAVFGLGYVGLVAAACHAASGHRVIGVESDSAKLASLRRGVPPVSEPHLPGLLKAGLNSGRIELTDDSDGAVANTDYGLICVGTPTGDGGRPDLSDVMTVTREIGAATHNRRLPYNVVLRSTVPPGTSKSCVGPLLRESSGKRVGTDVKLFYNPEFLRQGSAVADFNDPPMVVVGGDSALRSDEDVFELYGDVKCDRVVLSYQEAELLKLACNSFHALKIDFANEIGTIADAVDADPARVMSALSLDTKLNVSSAYLRPGFAFGGSCLPKDVRALSSVAREHQLSLPLIESIISSNDSHLRRAVERLSAIKADVIGIVGVTFKPNTDDLRESAAVRLVNALVELGKDVVVYEPQLMNSDESAPVLGKLAETLPTLAEIMVDWSTLMRRASVLILTRQEKVLERAVAMANRPVIDITVLRDTATGF